MNLFVSGRHQRNRPLDISQSPFAPANFPILPYIVGVEGATAGYGFYSSTAPERDDVFLFAFAEGTKCAGVFTRSTTASEDISWCRDAIRKGGGQARCLIVNAGNSNAFTGEFGRQKNASTVEALTRTLDVAPETCFLAATGVIGEPLPSPSAIASLVPSLKEKLESPDWEACAKAFMTTDTFAKGAGRVFELEGREISIAGIAKGSGMIAPNMATMLAYVFTDLAIDAEVLDALIRDITDRTFNSISVDGDTSTSDSFMIFATGNAGNNSIVSVDDPRYQVVKEEFEAVAKSLALQIVEDGEGATKVVTVKVVGAQSKDSARVIACSIANSPLVKTAIAAGDANWGRIVMAIGKSYELVERDKLAIYYDRCLVAEGGGRASSYREEAVSAVCAQSRYTITVDLGMGTEEVSVYTCDLTERYIHINGSYRT